MDINSHTELYCIFGKPVKHSLSPVMQNRAFNELGKNAVYMAFEPTSIESAIQSMKTLNIIGASVTIPYKVDALKYVDKIDPLAEYIGSINTLHNNNNIITGFNTDGIGALQALIDENIPVKNSNILILGNGGSARAIAFTLLKEGSSIYIAGRNIDRITKLTNDLKKHYSNVDSILLNKINNDFMENVNIILNTTSVGMTPDINSSPLHNKLFLKNQTVFDIVYSPDMTLLLKSAEQKGCRIIKGIEMLVNQGIKQFEIWTGEKAPAEAMYKSLHSALYNK